MNDGDVDRLRAALSGRYDIERELGQGGMATVYLAQDLKHSRRVALKVLKPELAAVVGADRFLTEIQTTANLHHPHILPLHDSGEADGFLFYVMPYVDGESLRERLDREHQLPVDEAVRIAKALAGALDHAHQRGVIHRDIKPANILMQDGEPMMADFGIALAVGAAGGARLTETGLSVGTPYYMSPEQATGDQSVGPASDTYALACVLYEMLVGEPPYPGATAQAVLGKIIAGEAVSATKLRPSIPPNVDATIRRALEKLPADRFRSAEEFSRALVDPSFRHGALAGAREPAGGRWKRVALATTASTVLLAAWSLWSVLSPEAPRPVYRYAVGVPSGHDPLRYFGSNLAISPDGSLIAYVGPGPQGQGQQLWTRRRDQLEPAAVPGTEGATNPAFSPDGRRIAFVTLGPNVLKVVSLGGEPPLTLATENVDAGGVAWASDGFLYTDSPTGLSRVSEGGGTLEPFTKLDSASSESAHFWPQALPNGRGLLINVAHEPVTQVAQYDVAVVDLRSGDHHILVRGIGPRYAASGHVVYVSADGTLLAAPFDQDRMELEGAPVSLAQGIGIGVIGTINLAISQEGSLAYVTGSSVSGMARVVWVDRAGTVTPVDPDWVFDPGQPEVALELSPDGTRLAVKENTDAGEDIWVKELDRGPRSRLTFDDAADRRPRWSADGSRIMYTSMRGGQWDLWSQPADGTGSPEVLLDLDKPILEVQRSPDDQWFILRLGGVSGQTGIRDLVGLHSGDTATVPLAAEPYDEKAAALSPSGRWLAYESNETGRDEVYVRPFPNVQGGKWQVSTGGGFNPRWAHSERELFYVSSAGSMVAAEVQGAAATFRVGARQPLFSVTDRLIYADVNYASWDVAPDDQRFIMVQLNTEDEDEARQLVLVEGFFEELREKVRR